MRRRPNLHPFLNAIPPASTALIIIDMQSGYLDAAYGSIALASARDIVPSVNRLAEALRGAGGCIVWVKSRFASDASASGLSYAVSVETLKRFQTLFSEGHEAYSIWPELIKPDGDFEITKKNSFAAFYGSDGTLDELLEKRGVNTILIAGLQTSICCETTAREASVRGLKTIMVSDANAGRLKQENEATYSIFLRAFGDVATSDELIQQIKTRAHIGR